MRNPAESEDLHPFSQGGDKLRPYAFTQPLSFMKNSLFLLITFLFCLQSSAAEVNNPPVINVVYPREGQDITAYDSTFIFGSLTPGSELSINGQKVNVHKNGAFIAYLPLQPGDFVFDLIAYNQYGISTKLLKVKVPSPFLPAPKDTLRIEPYGKNPSVDLLLNPGDIIRTGFQGTPGCSALFYIEGLTSFIPMTESYEKTPVYWGEGVWGSWKSEDSVIRKGIYTGVYKLKSTDRIENGKIVFELYKKIENPDSFYYPAEAFFDREKMQVCMLDSAAGRITIKEDLVPRIVELKDTTTIIRTGPQLGYKLLYQPGGIRFLVTGKAGVWLKLRLAENIEGWAREELFNSLPSGTPVPQSNIKLIRTISLNDRTKIRIPLNQKIPYEILQELDPPILTLKLYGGNSDVDWIRYDTRDGIIKEIRWEQPQKGVFELKIYLKQKRFWGYDLYYQGSELNLDIKKEPEIKSRLKGLRICLDPGHSPDPGAVGPTGLEEKVVNLEIANNLKKLLEKNGAEVILTRYGAEEVGIYERADKAVKNNCNILISIHNNALPDGVNPFYDHGTSTYYYHPQSLGLARSIQQALVGKLELPDEGYYYGNLALSRPHQLLSVLVECAFIMLPEQEELLREDSFQKKIASGIYQGILEFIRGDKND